MVTRQKWKTTRRNLAVRDFVLEHDHNLRRGEWSTGRVVRVFPWTDGLVCAVDIASRNGIFRIGIRHLSLLEPVIFSKSSS